MLRLRRANEASKFASPAARQQGLKFCFACGAPNKTSNFASPAARQTRPQILLRLRRANEASNFASPAARQRHSPTQWAGGALCGCAADGSDLRVSKVMVPQHARLETLILEAFWPIFGPFSANFSPPAGRLRPAGPWLRTSKINVLISILGHHLKF